MAFVRPHEAALRRAPRRPREWHGRAHVTVRCDDDAADVAAITSALVTWCNKTHARGGCELRWQDDWLHCNRCAGGPCATMRRVAEELLHFRFLSVQPDGTWVPGVRVNPAVRVFIGGTRQLPARDAEQVCIGGPDHRRLERSHTRAAGHGAPDGAPVGGALAATLDMFSWQSAQALEIGGSPDEVGLCESSFLDPVKAPALRALLAGACHCCRRLVPRACPHAPEQRWDVKPHSKTLIGLLLSFWTLEARQGFERDFGTMLVPRCRSLEDLGRWHKDAPVDESGQPREQTYALVVQDCAVEGLLRCFDDYSEEALADFFVDEIRVPAAYQFGENSAEARMQRQHLQQLHRALVLANAESADIVSREAASMNAARLMAGMLRRGLAEEPRALADNGRLCKSLTAPKGAVASAQAASGAACAASSHVRVTASNGCASFDPDSGEPAVSISELVACGLCVQEPCGPDTPDLVECVARGPAVHPGAHYVVSADRGLEYLEGNMTPRDAAAWLNQRHLLFWGRHPKSGERHLLKRSPVYSWHSCVRVPVVVVPGDAVSAQAPMCVLELTDLDFDGDCFELYMISDPLARYATEALDVARMTLFADGSPAGSLSSKHRYSEAKGLHLLLADMMDERGRSLHSFTRAEVDNILASQTHDWSARVRPGQERFTPKQLVELLLDPSWAGLHDEDRRPLIAADGTPVFYATKRTDWVEARWQCLTGALLLRSHAAEDARRGCAVSLCDQLLRLCAACQAATTAPHGPCGHAALCAACAACRSCPLCGVSSAPAPRLQ